MFKSDVRSVPLGILMKFDVDDKNRCRLVCVKFLLNRCRFAAAVAKCLGGLTFFGTQCRSAGAQRVLDTCIRVFYCRTAVHTGVGEVRELDFSSVQFSLCAVCTAVFT